MASVCGYEYMVCWYGNEAVDDFIENDEACFRRRSASVGHWSVVIISVTLLVLW